MTMSAEYRSIFAALHRQCPHSFKNEEKSSIEWEENRNNTDNNNNNNNNNNNRNSLKMFSVFNLGHKP